MTRNEMIHIIFQIKENPEGHDFSSYLYSAVGLLKREGDAGTAYAALQLVDTIEKAVGGKENLSEFCQKRIAQIEKLCQPAMCRFLEKSPRLMKWLIWMLNVEHSLRQSVV